MSNVVLRVENLSKKFRTGTGMPHNRISESLYSLSQILWNASSFRRSSKSENGSLTNDSKPEREFWALRDINFELCEGEVLGIIGRNGAGKSTLLKILSRITQPTEGRFGIKGRVSSLLEVGTGFHPELTGRENVFLSGSLLGMSRQDINRKFDAIADFAGVERFLDTPVKRYSSGMKVRLGFAVAAHLDPEILIVDEVLAVGDAEFQSKCLGKMGEVSQSGRTILFVSHNLSAVRSLCSRAILLENGSVKFESTAEQTVTQYLNRGEQLVRQVALSERTDRTGNQMFRFVGCSIAGDQELIATGEPIEFKLQYEADPSQLGKSIDIATTCFTNDGEKLFTLSTIFEESGYRCMEQSGELSVTIPSLPLLPGRYRLSLWAHGSKGLADFIERAIDFEVAPCGPNSMIGISHNAAKHGPLFVNCDWNRGLPNTSR